MDGQELTWVAVVMSVVVAVRDVLLRYIDYLERRVKRGAKESAPLAGSPEARPKEDGKAL